MDTLRTIQEKIGAARAKSPLAAPLTTLVGVSKGHGADRIAPFIRAGLSHFGENRVQEAREKWGALKKDHPGVTLHLIGPLQTNKVADALELFDVIQTLDRKKLIDEIAKQLPRYKSAAARTSLEPASWGEQQASTGSKKKFFVQINTGEEEQKSGAAPRDAKDMVNYAREKGLDVVGLMCIPPAGDMPAPHFALLKKIADDCGVSELSMGMSGDYETAVRMGATHVRVGTALFGERV